VEHICFEHALIDHIVASGSHMVARLIRTRDGANFVRRMAPTPHATKELYYAIFEFIGGEDKYSWTSNRLSDEEYAYSGRSLAELHCAAAGFDPGALPSPHEPILERLASLPEDLRRCADLAADSCFDKYFLHNLPEMLRISQQTSEQLTETAELPVIGIHGDFHPGNQKYNLNRVIGVFDFDRACLDLRVFDVALAVIYFCSCWEGNMDGNLWLHKAALFLQAYQKRTGRTDKPGPLLPQEIRLMFAMLNAASLSLLKWAAADAYYLETENCPDEEYLFYLKHHVRLLRWLEANRSPVEDMLQESLIQT
jgi:homoserine kinase type II